MDLYNIEDEIMKVWAFVDDLELLTNAVCEQDLSTDDIANTLIGIQSLMELRCRKLFDTYQQVLKQNANPPEREVWLP